MQNLIRLPLVLRRNQDIPSSDVIRSLIMTSDLLRSHLILSPCRTFHLCYPKLRVAVLCVVVPTKASPRPNQIFDQGENALMNRYAALCLVQNTRRSALLWYATLLNGLPSLARVTITIFSKTFSTALVTGLSCPPSAALPD